MTIGVGGSTASKELSLLRSTREQTKPIELAEYHQRLQKVRELMQQAKIDVLYLDGGSPKSPVGAVKAYAT